MYLMRKSILVFVLCISVLFSFSRATFAQSSTSNNSQSVQGAATLGVAYLMNIKGKNIKDGSVISGGRNAAQLTTVTYDPQVLGIVSRNAAILINTSSTPNGTPVVSQGTVYILVSTKNGVIKNGDLLASSTIPGIAVKAVKEGYVLGTALEDYSDTNANHTGLIAADINLHYFNSKPTFPGTLTDIFKIALLPTKDSPAAIFKYIVAAGVVLGSFVLAFLTFGRTAAKGIEALGRNPAASKIIHLGIIFNVMIIGFIILAGLTVAFLILRL